MKEVERTFVLAIAAVEALHGEAEVRLLAEHALDAEKRNCAVDAGTKLGWDLCRLFTQFLTRQLGPDSFSIDRIPNIQSAQRASS